MRVVEISFSPTGGTKKVADGLCKHLNDSFEVVDLSDSACDFANVSFFHCKTICCRQTGYRRSEGALYLCRKDS